MKDKKSVLGLAVGCGAGVEGWRVEGFLVGETGADAITRFFTLRPRCKKKKKKKKCEKKAKTIAGCLLRKKKRQNKKKWSTPKSDFMDSRFI